MNIGLYALWSFLLVSTLGFVVALINFKLLNNQPKEVIKTAIDLDETNSNNKNAIDLVQKLSPIYGYIKVREIVNLNNLDFVIVGFNYFIKFLNNIWKYLYDFKFFRVGYLKTYLYMTI